MFFTIIHSLLILFTTIYVLITAQVIWGWYKAGKLVYPSISYSEKTKVSIIIPVRNEEKMISRCLNSIRMQSYPSSLIEVIVINDQSTDNTLAKIQKAALPNIKVIHLKPMHAGTVAYKKKAIAEAIAVAQGDLIITTDGDCWAGKNWIASIVSEYEHKGYKLISSPVAYTEEKSFFEQLQTLEFSALISLGGAAIATHSTGTCNGANLCYEKNAFFEVGCFNGIDDVASGDDELLLHKMQEKFPKKVGFLKKREAIVFTHGKETIAEFISQRKRWASKTTAYKSKAMLLKGISIYIYNLLLLAAFVYALISSNFSILNVLWIKFLADFIWFYGVLRFFRYESLIALIPILEIIHIFYLIYIGIAGQFGKIEWKGRAIR